MLYIVYIPMYKMLAIMLKQVPIITYMVSFKESTTYVNYLCKFLLSWSNKNDFVGY